mgnify:FL=1
MSANLQKLWISDCGNDNTLQVQLHHPKAHYTDIAVIGRYQTGIAFFLEA